MHEGGASSSSSSSGPVQLIGGSASSSSAALAPCVAVPSPSAGDSGAELGQPRASASTTTTEVQALMQDVDFDLPTNGGIVRRLGQPIGKITPWPNGKNIGVRCSMHPSCSVIVGSKVPLDACVLWLARGVAPPPLCTSGERTELKNQHQKCPKPRAIHT